MAGLGVGLMLAGAAALAYVASTSKKKTGGATPEQNAAAAQQLYHAAMNTNSTDAAYYQDVIRQLIVLGYPDLATGVYNHAKQLGVNEALLQQAVNQATSGIVATPETTSMPLNYKQKIEQALRALGIDPVTGQFTKTPTQAGVQAATMIADQLERAGYAQAAVAIRAYASQAAALIAGSTEPTIPVEISPNIPEALLKACNTALAMEGSPARLRELANALRKLPNASDPMVQTLIGMLEAKAAQIEGQQVLAEAAEQTDAVLTGHGSDVSPSPITALPPTSATPVQPVPKTETQIAAEAMCANMKAVQAAHGMPAAKGKEDVSLVKRFQTLAGTTSDGKAGPGTLVLAAEKGACNLPLVMYWPKSATASRVYQYREDIRRVASMRSSTCRALLESAASKEKGQAGIVGALAS